MYLKYIVFLLLLIIFQSGYAYAKSIPVIVIAPSKNHNQSQLLEHQFRFLMKIFLKIQKKYF